MLKKKSDCGKPQQKVAPEPKPLWATHPVSPWQEAAGGLTPPIDEMHVWGASLDVPTSQLDQLHLTLDANERRRPLRYHFRVDRDRFVAARGALRAILGRHLGVDPPTVRFFLGPYGKPEHAGENRADSIRFSVSHSGGLALYAIARGREVGVDLERIRPDVVDAAIAGRFFSPAEVESLRGLPEGQRIQAFFSCWTRKEAYVKARGEGLSLPLDRFVVSLVPGESAALVRDEGDPRAVSRWSLHQLDPGHGYAGALAVEGHGWQLKCWRWVV